MRKASLKHFFQEYIVPLASEFMFVLQNSISAFASVLSTSDSTKYKADFTNASSLLSESGIGFCLDGKRQLSAEHSQRNALVAAPTGMGKSTVIAIPTLLKMQGSFVINDPSQELYQTTAGYLSEKGYDVRVINFADPALSNGYNPLTKVNSASDCNKIAFMLVKSVLTNTGDPFWKLQSISLLTLVIQILQHEDSTYRNLANVRHVLQLLSTQPKIMDTIVVRTGSRQLLNDYKQFLTYDIKVQAGVIATCLAALQLFTDTAVSQITAFDTLDLEKIRHQKMAIFIHSSTSDMKYYSVLISILFEQMTKFIMTDIPSDRDLPVYFILDELSSLYLPTLQITAANIRKYKGGLLLIVQDYQQLIDIYGKQEAESIRSNTFAKVYFGGQSHSTAVEISQQLGKYQFENEDGKTGIRELRTPDEVRMLSSNHAILIAANHKPVLLDLRPYYQNPFLKLKTNLQLPFIKGRIANPVFPLLEV